MIKVLHASRIEVKDVVKLMMMEKASVEVGAGGEGADGEIVEG